MSPIQTGFPRGRGHAGGAQCPHMTLTQNKQAWSVSGAGNAGGGDAALETKIRPRPGLIPGVRDRAVRSPPEQPRRTLLAPVD